MTNKSIQKVNKVSPPKREVNTTEEKLNKMNTTRPLSLPDTQGNGLRPCGTNTKLSAAQCGEEDNNTITLSHIDAFEEDDIFSELQSLWDEQTRHIDHILATHPEAYPVRLNLRHRRPWRRLIMAEYLILALLNIAAGIYTLFAFPSFPTITFQTNIS